MEKLLTPKELADMLGISVQTLYNRRSTGGSLPRAVLIGRLVRFRQIDVDFWINGLSSCPVAEESRERPRHHLEKPIRRGRPTKEEVISRRARADDFRT